MNLGIVGFPFRWSVGPLAASFQVLREAAQVVDSYPALTYFDLP